MQTNTDTTASRPMTKTVSYTPSRFDYVKYDDDSSAVQAAMKKQFQELEYRITTDLPTGPAQSTALRKLEESYMWVGKAIRDRQVARNPDTELQEQRTNS